MKRAAASAWSIGRLPWTLAPRGCGSARSGGGRSGFDAAFGVIEAAAVADDGIGIVLGPQLGMQHGAVVAIFSRAVLMRWLRSGSRRCG